jgi:NAD(P)-dependent dehydrogenase (short-subunit alcohol dehydrogenase family)
MDFSDRTVVITGAAGNLGGAVARVFARGNADLVLVDRRVERLAARFGAENARQRFVAADLASPTETADVAAQALRWFQRIDVLCNLAGGFRAGLPVHETPDEMIDALFDVNVRSMLHMVRAVVPTMLAQQDGAIVNVAAFAAQKAAARMGAYAAMKAVVVRLSEAMAAELRDANIRVNCVLPTTLDTPANRADMPGADTSKWVPLDDLAETIAFLASPAAKSVCGAALAVTGKSAI